MDYDDYKAAGVKVVSKGGDIMNQHAELLVAPDEEISVSVLSSGGNSSVNSLMAMSLMDIALEEKGINIEHRLPEKKETLDTVPERYLAFEDLYFSGNGLYLVYFPEGKYMEISCITGDRKDIKRYMYTTEDSFVQVEGNISAGKAVQGKNQSVLTFRRRDGRDYICEDVSMDMNGCGNVSMSHYSMQRAEKSSVSDEVLAAWDARNGKKYYLYNGKYSNTYYAEMPSVKVQTYPEARGYIKEGRIIDSDHVKSDLVMPGGRDVQDIEIRKENGVEILDITNCAMEMISEDAIKELPENVSEIKLHTKKASWYRIGAQANKTITLDIPENAAVYVYDKFDRMIYSSYFKDYGSSVPMPAEGKIVFLGEDGGTIGITQ